MFDWLSSIKEGIVNLPKNFADSIIQPILNGIKAIFVPDADFITNRWNSIKDRFSFAESISATADIIVRFFKDTAFDEPPKVYIDLGYAESKYDYGGTTYCLDMTWYARYKPIVDVFLSAWIWITFIWRVYTHLPNIINGVAGGFEVASDVRDYDNYNKYGHKFSNSYGDFRDERREFRRFINFRRFRK